MHEYFNSFFKKHKITQKRFCELVDVSESTIKSLKAKGYYPSFDTLKKIIAVFPDFALMEGFDLVDEVEHSHSKGAPYYNVSFAAGWKNLKDHFSYNIDFPPLAVRGDVFWVNQLGEAMSPSIVSGDKVALEKKDISEISFGKIYGVVSSKRLRSISWVARSPLEGHIRLIPENKDPKFGEYHDVPLIEVKEVYEVVGLMRSF